MRILLLWDYYETYLRQFYLRHDGIQLLPFLDQNRLLLNDAYHWPAFLLPEFRALGHEAEAIIGNADPAQMMWARENSFSSVGDVPSLRRHIVRAQVRQFRPDILWICGAQEYLGQFLRSLRDYCGAVVAWRASEGGQRLDWNGVDCVLSSHAHFIELFRNMGLRAEAMLPCMDPNLVAECLSDGVRDQDVTFAGSLSIAEFTSRLALLSALSRSIQSYGFYSCFVWRRRPWPIRTFLSQSRYFLFPFRTRIRPPVYGREMLRLLARSKVAVNAHGFNAAGLAGNSRMFEATAMGALLVTENSRNLAELFEPDREVITYRSILEAVERVKYYLCRPEEREAIARAGQERTLRDHNTRKRAEQALQLFGSLRLH
jgi:hypothetical protein